MWWFKAELEAKHRVELEEKRRVTQLNEQERRDHDLAMRLAPDFGNAEVEPAKSFMSSSASPPKSPLSSSSFTTASGRKYDLSKWKYAELRDAINTSCDIDLLEACREEFHRRLKVYHAWKSKNKKQGDSASTPTAAAAAGGDLSGLSDSSQRAPASIIDHKEMLIDFGSPVNIKSEYSYSSII